MPIKFLIMKGKYLITADNWFVAPDGKSYRAVWGEAKTMTAAEALGLEPNRNSANWMVRVGTDEHHIILAGCQIHYAVSCPERPNQGDTSQIFSEDKGVATVRSNQIFIPEDFVGIMNKLTTAKTFEFLKDLTRLRMDSENYRDLLADKAHKIGVKYYRAIREPYYRTYNILDILWGDETETREILYQNSI